VLRVAFGDPIDCRGEHADSSESALRGRLHRAMRALLEEVRCDDGRAGEEI
jgi:hypothetical protein